LDRCCLARYASPQLLEMHQAIFQAGLENRKRVKLSNQEAMRAWFYLRVEGDKHLVDWNLHTRSASQTLDVRTPRVSHSGFAPLPASCKIRPRFGWQIELHRSFEIRSHFSPQTPGSGHRRDNLTTENVRFSPVYSYLIVYRLDTKPLQIAAILHGRRDLERILTNRF
jgi:hypothetical protein